MVMVKIDRGGDEVASEACRGFGQPSEAKRPCVCRAERQIREIRLVAFKAQLPLLQHLWIDVEDVLDGRDGAASRNASLGERRRDNFNLVRVELAVPRTFDLIQKPA
jgi:hypothetical protein